MKKFKRSPISFVCYVIGLLLFVCFLYIAGTTIAQVNEYYAAYEMSPGIGEVLGYLVQNSLAPFGMSVLIFMAGIILDAVRRNNPENWVAVAGADKTPLFPTEDESAEKAVEAEAVEEEAADEAEAVVEEVTEVADDAVVVEEAVEAEAEDAAQAADEAVKEGTVVFE